MKVNLSITYTVYSRFDLYSFTTKKCAIKTITGTTFSHRNDRHMLEYFFKLRGKLETIVAPFLLNYSMHARNRAV